MRRKVAYLFPGQGSQSVGMGKHLVEAFPEARVVFEQADGRLDFALSELCFHGPAEELTLTENAQPAILTASIAAFSVLQSRGLMPDYVAGHSLGEYSAVVAAGGLELEEAVHLVRLRGKYMQEAVPPGQGAMAALIYPPFDKLEEILQQASANGEIVTAANYNSPQQVVIAGHRAAVERAVELAKQAGAKRAVLLRVSAPFHCPLMEPAREKMRPHLEAATIHDLQIPLVNGWKAELVQQASSVREGLVEQITAPVRWTDVVRRLLSEGVELFVEVGPGTVLSGLVKQCTPPDRPVEILQFSEPDQLSTLEAAMQQ